MATDVLRIGLGLLLCGAGVGHVVAPGYFRSLVPPWMPRPGPLVVATGVADVVVGVALLIPDTARIGGAAAAVLITGYLSSHLDAIHRRDPAGPLLTRPLVIALRLIVNLAYIAIALAVATTLP